MICLARNIDLVPEEGHSLNQVVLNEVLSKLNSTVTTAVARAGLFEGLTSAALMSVTGGIPVLGVADEILGLVGLGGDKGTKKAAVKNSGPRTYNN